MTDGAKHPPHTEFVGEPDTLKASSLREQGLQHLRAGAHDLALECLARADAQDPGDHQTLLSLGIARQGKRQHALALALFERAQKTRPDDSAPFLHASLSLLALGRAQDALAAASEARARAPLLPQAHSAVGQALLALKAFDRAEAAFAAALQYAPASADLWVLCGVARFRRGDVDGARQAMREALRHAPDHAVAQDNLAALSGGGERTAVPALPRPQANPIELANDRRLSAWKPKDASACLGLAVEFLSKMPAFAKLPFGEWSQVLFYQVARGHCFFVVDQDSRVRGFLGWALTDQALAEQWVEGRAGLRNDQCIDGDCVIINAFAAETADANSFIRDTMRGLFGAKRILYFKRHYPDGRTRPASLSVNHLACSAARRFRP